MTSVERVRRWACDTALPVWADAGFDRSSNMFVECLDLSGKPQINAPRRVRAQARQIYVYARAHRAGWFDGVELSMAAMESLIRFASENTGDGGWAHLLDGQGRVLDGRRDLYDHAFILLALAEAYRVCGEERFLDAADRTIAFMDREMAHTDGGYVEEVGGKLPRRQNPHMHLFEAFLALSDATGREEDRERADGVARLFSERFFDRKSRMLREFFTEDWAPWSSGAEDVWEPGHHSEWIWLLAWHARVRGRPMDPAAEILFDRLRAEGRIDALGLLHARIGSGGETDSEPSRTWMQTEYIKALLTRYEAGNADMMVQVERAIDALFEHHLDPAPAGGWVDHIDGTGHGVSDTIPASTFYHLICCMTEVERVLGENR